MPEARATLIVEAKDEASATLAKIGASGGKAGKETEGSFNKAVKELTGFNVASLAGVGGITALVGVAAASIKKNMEWADTIDRVSRATGESAESTSLMVTAFGAAGISVQTLESSFKVLTKNGLQPNMETFKKLAVEYQSITDPVERNTFAMKNLGRSAAEMTEILSKTPAELDALAAAAARSGKVIDEEMIAKAEELAIKSQQLQDKLDGLMIQVGGPLVDTLSAAADGFDGLTKIIALNTVETQLQYGAITEQEAALKRLEIATGGVGTAWEEYNAAIAPATDAHERASATTQILTQDQADMKQQIDVAALAWQGYSPSVSDAVREQGEMVVALNSTKQAQQNLSDIIGGAVGAANEEYSQSVAEQLSQIAATEAELNKLNASHGQEFVVTTEAKHSVEEYQLAQIKAAEAAQKAAEFTGDDIEEKLKLQVAAQGAAEKVATMAGELGSSTTATLNNQKAIDELNVTLAEQEAAMAELTAAHEEATARIVFGFVQQRLAADGLQEGEIAMLGEIGKAWGIYDEATATALSAVDTALTKHGTNAQGVIDALGTSIDGLPTDKTITITTNYVTHGSPVVNSGAGVSGGGQNAGGSGFASGANFIVPPGYPNDSFPMRVQSGEHVQVTPAGGGMGGMSMEMLVGALTRSIRDALLTA